VTRHRLRAALAASVAMLTLATASLPAQAQWIVYDPTNFSQNVLTAARELQQVNQNICRTRRWPSSKPRSNAPSNC
jgi:P-type conjugative transfer protein TrbJ